MSSKCPYCGSERLGSIETSCSYGYGSLNLRGYGGVTLNACLDCGIVFIDPKPKKEGEK